RADQISLFAFRGALWRWTENRQAIRKTGVGFAVGFDGVGQDLHGVDGGLFVVLDLRAIPLLAEGGQVKHEQTEREKLPLAFFSNQAHEDAMRVVFIGS